MQRLLAIGLLFLAGTAAAQGLPDQVNTGPISVKRPVITQQSSLAQTFRAGRTGKLVRLIIGLDKGPLPLPGPDLRVTIRAVATNAELASVSLPAASLPNWDAPSLLKTVVFALPPTVTAGQDYVIVLTNTGTNTPHYQHVNVVAGATDPYPAGALLRMGADHAWEPVPTVTGFLDLDFQTFVDVLPVDLLAALIKRVQDSGVDPGTRIALLSSLTQARTLLTDASTSNDGGAIELLQAFLSKVAALRGSQVTAALADGLTADGNEVIASLNVVRRQPVVVPTRPVPTRPLPPPTPTPTPTR
jgi:hypothetical protein